MNRFFFSLRFRLVLLVLFAVIPALVITFYSGLERRQILSTHIKEDMLRVARLVSLQQSQLVEESRHFLYMLSQLPQVKSMDPESCCVTFANLMKQYPWFLNIGAAYLNGNVFASAVPYQNHVNIADRTYFQMAVKTRGFAIGEYQIGRIHGKPSVNFGYPVIDRNGKAKAVVFVSLSLDWLKPLSAHTNLPAGSMLTLLDHNGRILSNHPDPEGLVGKTIKDASIFKTILSQREGTIENTGEDGIRRLYAFTEFGGTGQTGGIHLIIETPTSIAYSQLDWIMKRNLFFLSLIGLIAFAAIWVGGDLFILRRVNPILSAAKQIGAGNLSARTGISYGEEELSQLAFTFDEMTNSLERREKERKDAEEALRESEGKYRELADFLPEVVFETDEKGMLTFANQHAFDTFGYTQKDLEQGLNGLEIILPEEYDRAKDAFQKALTAEKSREEFTMRKKDGSLLSVIIQVAPIIRNGQTVGLRGIALDITERKRSEEELQKAFSELSAIYENVPILMILLDHESRVKKINGTAAQFVGRTPQEAEGLRGGEALRCLHSLDDPRGCGFGASCNQCTLRKVVLNTLKNGKSYYGIETKLPFLLHGRKEEKYLLTNTSPVIIGDTKNALVCLQDITQLKLVEENLRESMETLQTFVDSNPETSLLLDERGTILIANETMAKRLGKEKEEIIGTCVYDLFPEEVGKRRKAYIDEVFQTGQSIRFEDQRLDRHYETFVFPIFDIRGRVTKVSILGIDITKRKKMEEELQRSEERYRQLFNEAPVGYHEFDIEGRITEVNQTELDMLGYTREEMIGHWVWEFIEEEISEDAVKRKIAEALPPGNTFERTYRKKDGSLLPALIMDRILYDREGKVIGIRSTLQDITKLKEAEKKRASLEEQFRQSQKMEAIGRLAGGIAHDFNNLLTVIKGYSEFSLIDLKENDPIRENIEEIRKASERAANLTRHILAFSRRQILETKVLDLNIILQDFEKMLRRIIGEDIELVIHLSSDLGKVKTDSWQIEQVIMNLAVNARDAMQSGGKLTIETANVVLDEEYARNHVAVKPGPYVMLSVSDTGCGMSPEVKERIFEPFFTTKEKGKGTGLGLSTVYGIVKQSGGSIWVYSEQGYGTTFKIYLPRVDEPIETMVEKEVIQGVPKGKETILIVEDDEAVRKLAVRFLEKQGYTVFEAHREYEAVTFCKEWRNPLHLILTDVVMPVSSGKKLIENIREVRRDFKVLYMSGYTDNSIVHHGILEKGVNFIQKPFTYDGLARKVREVLDREDKATNRGLEAS